MHPRAISEIVSGIILFAVVLTVTLAVFFYTAMYIDNVKASTEYGYVKTVFTKMGMGIKELLGSTRLEYTYPHETIGIGYMAKNTTIILEVGTSSNNPENITLLNKCYILTGTTMRSLLPPGTPRIILGSNKSLVDSVNEIPLIYEYYSNGSTTIIFDVCRLYYVLEVEASGGSNYSSLTIILFNLTSIDSVELPPKVTGQGYLFISRRQEDDEVITFYNITRLNLYVNGEKINMLERAGIQSASLLKIAIKPIRILIG